MAGAARVSSEIRDPQVLLSDPAFQKKVANTEVILFNGFTFTTQKVQGIDAAQKALINEAINAAKSSPDNIVIVDTMG